jgi:hypothetical protein
MTSLNRAKERFNYVVNQLLDGNIGTEYNDWIEDWDKKWDILIGMGFVEREERGER